jgi:RNA recognition motif-containing protein
MSDFSQDQTTSPVADDVQQDDQAPKQAAQAPRQGGQSSQQNDQAANPKKLFVGNLSWSLTSEDLQQLFSEYGTVEEAFVLTDKFSGRSKGFGFVTMSSADEAQAAIDGLHEREVDGRQLAVNIAQPPKPRTEWGGRERRSSGGGDRRFGGNDRGNDRGGDRRQGGYSSYRRDSR